jgi:hypothetical protein
MAAVAQGNLADPDPLQIHQLVHGRPAILDHAARSKSKPLSKR